MDFSCFSCKLHAYLIKKLPVIFVLVFMLSPLQVAASQFVKLRIFPEHVGVFTVDGKQQFVAFGYLPNGLRKNVTKQVDWISSNPNIVTINENGLAKIVAGKTAGQVKISCRYPKTGKISPVMNAVNILLLSRPEPEADEEKPVFPARNAIYLLLL
jgi:hypothetical protein